MNDMYGEMPRNAEMKKKKKKKMMMIERMKCYVVRIRQRRQRNRGAITIIGCCDSLFCSGWYEYE